MRISQIVAALAVTCAIVAFENPSITARAQLYPSQSPKPRTTDVPMLHEAAVRREIHERFTIGVDAEIRGDWHAAIPEFERIIELYPPEPQGSTANYDLAIAYANVGRYDDAATGFRAAIDLDPGFLAAMANLVAVDIKRGNLRDARTFADRFIALAPDSARALYSRGLVALRSGDATTAAADFGRLLARNPNYAIAHYDLGLAEQTLGNDTDAERDFTDALSLAPSYARARFALGTLLLKRGDRNGARAAFAQAARDAQGDPALENLAIAMRDATH